MPWSVWCPLICVLLLWQSPFQSWPGCSLGFLILVPDPFPSLLLYLVVHSVLVTCLLKSISFIFLLDILMPVQVFVFRCEFLLILVWLVILSKVSLGALLISLLPGKNTCSLSALVRMRSPLKDIFYHSFIFMFRWICISLSISEQKDMSLLISWLTTLGGYKLWSRCYFTKKIAFVGL